jgi:hypothetical protein
MNNEHLYKHLYESVREDCTDAKNMLYEYVLFDIKLKLGEHYWDFLDYVVAKKVKEAIEYLEEDNDPYETPDNKALDLSSLYHTLKYHMVRQDYDAWIKDRMSDKKVCNHETF